MKSWLLILLILCSALQSAPRLGLKTAGASESVSVKQWVRPTLKLSHSSVTDQTELLILVRFSMDPDWHIYGNQETIGTRTELSVDELDFEVLQSFESEGELVSIDLGAGKTYTSHFLLDGAVVGLKVRPLRPLSQIQVGLKYQPCTKSTCAMVVQTTITRNLGFGLETANVLPPEFQTWPAEKPSPDKDISSQHWALALLQAFLWGLLASLTPCVYPMIPITVSLFSPREGSEAASSLSRLAKALAYVLGIVIVYACLGVVAARTGQDLGSWLAVPAVTAFLGLVMVLLALSLFGLYELDLPYTLKQKLNQVEGSSPLALFLMGGAMGFVAAPCVGPFAGAIIIYLVKNPQSVFFGFSLMAAFGAGMGVLFILIALFSDRFLPRSGVWMVHLKQVMGYVLLLVAFHFQTAFLDEAQINLGYSVWLILGGILAGATIRLDQKDPVSMRLKQGVGLLLVLCGLSIWPYYPQSRNNSVASAPVQAQEHTRRDLALEAAKKSGRPVMLYFTAKWCIPCNQIKRGILPDPEVVTELSRFEVAIIDCTQADSEGARQKQQVYQSAAMPFFAFYDVSQKERRDLRIEGKVSKEELLAALRKL